MPPKSFAAIHCDFYALRTHFTCMKPEVKLKEIFRIKIVVYLNGLFLKDSVEKTYPCEKKHNLHIH